MIETRFIQHIAEELEISPTQVAETIELLNGGATIPFIARYRKDVTGNLNEIQIEAISDRNTYFIALTDRRNFILNSLTEQGALPEELREEIENCADRTALEDFFLPYKKKQRTKGAIAKEKGLEPLADYLLHQPYAGAGLMDHAASFAKPDRSVSSPEEALDGACQILAEHISVDRETRAFLRQRMLREGLITAHPTKNAEGKKTKYENYYSFSEAAHSIPSHRFLAILRGVKEGFLRMDLKIDDNQTISDIMPRFLKVSGSPFEALIRQAVEDAFHHLLRPMLENEVISMLRAHAEAEAIRVFRSNAQNILLAPAAGPITVIGFDPDPKEGYNLAVVDASGAFLESAAIPLGSEPDATEGAPKVLVALMEKHSVRAVAIGNGPGGRDAAALVRGTLVKVFGSRAFCVLVNEAGASAYASSKTGKEEFPGLSVALRRAVSIARRLQNPLAENVRIEPRFIGVGQYQHDVNQKRLRDGLHRTMVSSVNKVGVDVNTASEALLAYVSGVQPQTAANIVAKRIEIGGFTSRAQLLDVDGIGPKAFEQCAGFLRVLNGAHPLDATAVHPEAYPIVERIAEMLGIPMKDLVGNPAVLDGLDLSSFATGIIGPHTLADIRNELVKPNCDPRTEFRVPRFREGVQSVADLEEGMALEGVVTNVTDFGVFVDIGINQDGLVHMSELANHFVRDPRSVAKVGDVIRVKVLKVDKDQPRISLSIKALKFASESRAERRTHRRRPAQQPGDAQTSSRTDAAVAAPKSTDAGETAVQESRPRHRERPHQSERRPSGRVRKAPVQGTTERQRQAASSVPLNTQLAEQLAAIRDRFAS